MDVRYDPSFLIEFDSQVTFFQEIDKLNQSSLAIGLAQDIQNSINRISLSPSIFQKQYKEVRVCSLDKFPNHSIHYQVDEQNQILYILQLRHQKQRPLD